MPQGGVRRSRSPVVVSVLLYQGAIDAAGQVKVLDEKVKQVYGLKKGDRKMG